MSISELLQNRTSCRGYKNTPVSQEVLTQVFTTAQRSPSNCNVQPWNVFVVSGAKKEQLKGALIQEVLERQKPNPDFDWNISYQGQLRDRQYESAAALYSAMNIEREDKSNRQKALLRNWAFFGAPHVAIFTMDKYLTMTGAVDLGIYAQNLSLLLDEQGISSCMQGALNQFPDPLHQLLDIPSDKGVLFGMSFGYADASVDANSTKTDRVELDQAVTFIE
ncbi:MAG: nitroreductase [Gammaproteobacteria bacterium]|nr:MAG: nitroreductase [Gammaproteobacteria bacterium]